MKFHLTWHWLELAKQWLEVTQLFLRLDSTKSWLDSDSTRKTLTLTRRACDSDSTKMTEDDSGTSLVITAEYLLTVKKVLTSYSKSDLMSHHGSNGPPDKQMFSFKGNSTWRNIFQIISKSVNPQILQIFYFLWLKKPCSWLWALYWNTSPPQKWS